MCVSHRGDVPRLNSPFFTRRFPPCLAGSLSLFPSSSPLLSVIPPHCQTYTYIHRRARPSERIRVCTPKLPLSLFLFIPLALGSFSPCTPPRGSIRASGYRADTLCAHRPSPEKISEIGREGGWPRFISNNYSRDRFLCARGNKRFEKVLPRD